MTRPARTAARLALASIALAAAAGASGAGPSSATDAGAAQRGSIYDQVTARASATNPSNPLAGRPWGVFKGRADQSWQPYVDSTGTNRALLAKISLRPKAKWFGRWISTATIEKKVKEYVANSTGGDPDVLVQMTVFRMKPWEHEACRRLPTAAETASFKRWTNRFAAGIGSARVALILQPDGPFALCAPGGSRAPSRLIGYATRAFSALPHTSVYIDAGASDWPKGKPKEAVKILRRAGVTHARGFALNSTHYESTRHNIYFGAQVVRELARQGVPGKHFVVNTAENGRPFEFRDAKGPDPDNAKACATKAERGCVTLGIPPTAAVASSRWGLSDNNRRRARAYVDAYLWFGRPWLYRQADPFDLQRALQIARTTPY